MEQVIHITENGEFVGFLGHGGSVTTHLKSAIRFPDRQAKFMADAMDKWAIGFKHTAMDLDLAEAC